MPQAKCSMPPMYSLGTPKNSPPKSANLSRECEPHNKLAERLWPLSTRAGSKREASALGRLRFIPREIDRQFVSEKRRPARNVNAIRWPVRIFHEFGLLSARRPQL